MSLTIHRRTLLGATLAAALAPLSLAAPADANVPAAPAGADVPGSAAPPVALRVATYNIHAGAGEDNVFDLVRTAEAIRTLDADVVGLQEVDVHWGARSDFVDEAQALADRLGMRAFFAPIYDFDPLTAGAPRRQYGVAILSRYPILRRRTTTSPGCPPRCPTPSRPRHPASPR